MSNRFSLTTSMTIAFLNKVKIKFHKIKYEKEPAILNLGLKIFKFFIQYFLYYFTINLLK